MNYVVMLICAAIGFLQIENVSFRNARRKPWLILSMLQESYKIKDEDYASHVGIIESNPTNGVVHPSIYIGTSKLVFEGDSSFLFDGNAMGGTLKDIKLIIWIENGQLYIIKYNHKGLC